MIIELELKKGIICEQTEILLGSDISDVKAKLGEADVFEQNYYFFEGDLLFHTNESGKILEIEIRNSDEKKIEARLGTVDVLKEEKKSLMNYLEQLNEGMFAYEYGTYSSDKLGISFSFGMTEEDIEEMIRESKEEGTYEFMQEEIDREIEKSKYLESFLIRMD